MIEGIRTQEWRAFSAMVAEHIEGYTIPQYGDAPNDEVSNWTIETCIKNGKKYLSRHGASNRQNEELLDMIKAVHFVQIAATKYMKKRLAEAANQKKEQEGDKKFLVVFYSKHGPAIYDREEIIKAPSILKALEKAEEMRQHGEEIGSVEDDSL